MKRILAFILTICMMISVFVSCAEKGDGKDDKSTNESERNEGIATGDSAGSETNKDGDNEAQNDFINAGLPGDLDFGEKEVNIVSWDNYDLEFITDETILDGDPVLDSIQKRAMYTEELLNVKFNIILNNISGSNSSGDMNNWCEKLKNIMYDNNTPVDLFLCYSRYVASATMNGLNQDLKPYTNLDFEKEWWPKNIQEEFALKDKLYMTTGDISSGVLFNMYCMFYNKTLAKELGKDDLVQLVKDKKWTIDKMFEITDGVFQDLDGEEGLSGGDLTGFTLDWWCYDAIIQGAGFKLLQESKDEDAFLELSNDFVSQKFDDFISKMGEWTNSDYVFSDNNYTGAAKTFFIEGRSLFHLNVARLGSDLQATDISYGILPPPMLDPEGQNNEYVTTLGNTYSIYSMPRNCPDGERAAAILQAMGYYGYKYTTPAVFDRTFKGKYSKDPDVSAMFDVVRKAIGFDLGILYQREINCINDIPTSAISNNKQWLSSTMDGLHQRSLNRSLSTFNDKLNKVING